jgi:hypothetical protein
MPRSRECAHLDSSKTEISGDHRREARHVLSGYLVHIASQLTDNYGTHWTTLDLSKTLKGEQVYDKPRSNFCITLLFGRCEIRYVQLLRSIYPPTWDWKWLGQPCWRCKHDQSGISAPNIHHWPRKKLVSQFQSQKGAEPVHQAHNHA